MLCCLGCPLFYVRYDVIFFVSFVWLFPMLEHVWNRLKLGSSSVDNPVMFYAIERARQPTAVLKA